MNNMIKVLEDKAERSKNNMPGMALADEVYGGNNV